MKRTKIKFYNDNSSVTVYYPAHWDKVIDENVEATQISKAGLFRKALKEMLGL